MIQPFRELGRDGKIQRMIQSRVDDLIGPTFWKPWVYAIVVEQQR